MARAGLEGTLPQSKAFFINAHRDEELHRAGLARLRTPCLEMGNRRQHLSDTTETSGRILDMIVAESCCMVARVLRHDDVERPLSV